MATELPDTSTAATAPPPEKANGLATYFGVIFAPSDAFATLARVPMWGWAAIMGMALLLIGTIVSMPEVLKISAVAQAHALSQMPADQQAVAQKNMAAFAGVTQGFIFAFALVGPWIFWIIAAVVFLIGAAFAKAAPKFDRAWVLAVNVFSIGAVAQVVNAIILAVRGPDAISSPADAYGVPSLALLAHDSPKLAAALYSLNPFQLWYYIVAALGLQVVMRMRPVAAWTTIIVFALIGMGLAAAFTR